MDDLQLNSQINIVVDYDESDMSIEVLNQLEYLDQVSLPNSIFKIYGINLKLDVFSRNSEQLDSDFFEQKLLTIGDDYETVIFDWINPETVSLEYFGSLENELFDLNELVIQSFQKTL